MTSRMTSKKILQSVHDDKLYRGRWKSLLKLDFVCLVNCRTLAIKHRELMNYIGENTKIEE